METGITVRLSGEIAEAVRVVRDYRPEVMLEWIKDGDTERVDEYENRYREAWNLVKKVGSLMVEAVVKKGMDGIDGDSILTLTVKGTTDAV